MRETNDSDVLVFTPGMFEIQRTIEEIRRGWRDVKSEDHAPPVVLALHGEMPPREQDRAFAPSAYRRVVVATNDESIVGSNTLIVTSEIREIATRTGDRLNLLGFSSAGAGG